MKNRRLLSLIMLVIAVFLMVSCKGKADTSQEEAVEANYVPVETAVVEAGEIYNTITLTGKVRGNKEVVVLSKSPGKVEEVFVGLGDKVKVDDKLISIDKEDISKQVDTARKQKDSAYSGYVRAKESTELAKATYARTLKLYNQNGVSKAQLEQAELQASEQPLDAAKTQYDLAVIAYENAMDLLKDANVKSPIDGVVTAVNVEAGDTISPQLSALTVVDMDEIYVELQITENIINDLSLGQDVEVEIGAMNKSYTGKIDRLSPVADPRTNLYQTKVYLKNDDFKIKPGMFAKVKFDIDYKDKVIRVPGESVITIGSSNYVFIVNGDKAMQKSVEIGVDSGDFVEILSGVNAGDLLVIKGQQYIKDDTNIRVVRGDK